MNGERRQSPIVGFGAAANVMAESEKVPCGVMLDRTAMALTGALEALRELVPNHHPARVEARKALDRWVQWSVEQASERDSDFGLGTEVRRNGRIFRVSGIGGNGGDFMHCSFEFVGMVEPEDTVPNGGSGQS